MTDLRIAALGEAHRIIAPICWWFTLWYSLRHWNPFTALGWVPIDGHDYADEDAGMVRCQRCGHREALRYIDGEVGG